MVKVESMVCAICSRHVRLGIRYCLLALWLVSFYLLRPVAPKGLGPGEEGARTELA